MDVVDGANAIVAGAERARTKEEIDFMLDDLVLYFCKFCDGFCDGFWMDPLFYDLFYDFKCAVHASFCCAIRA